MKVAGEKQFKEYWNKTVVNNTFVISDTKKNNRSEIFLTFKSKNPLRLHQKLKLVKNNIGPFSRLFIACQKSAK